MTLIGSEIRIGDAAPCVRLVGDDLADIDTGQFAGKVCVFSVVPSLDTPVCAVQTRKFNEAAATLSENVVILTVSLDLPFAQSRFCAAEGIENSLVASDYKYREFGEAYGVLIKELGLLTRAVFVVDPDRKVVYAQTVPEITDEPDYDAALEAVKGIA